MQDFYERHDRPEALRKLRVAIADAILAIRSGRAERLPAPRPYPELAQEGEAWMKTGRYWLCYSTAEPRQVLSIFFETADIPGRF